MSNGMSTAKESSQPGSKMDTSQKPQSSLTCVSSCSPAQPSNTEALRTWLQAAFPVSHSAPQQEDGITPKTSGRGCSVSYPQSSRDTSSRRTSQDHALFGTGCAVILKPKDIPFAGGALFCGGPRGGPGRGGGC